LVPLQVSRFHPNQLRRVIEIEQAAFPDEAYSREMFVELYRKCRDLFLVARLKRRVAGYSVTCIERGAAEIVSIAVVPELRSRGIGSALLEATLERLGEYGVPNLDLTVRVENTAAIRFYRRYGFEPVREVAGYYHNGGAGLRMRKPLGRGPG
jgi:ribosomal-protein-alanine N-acetyltransferase